MALPGDGTSLLWGVPLPRWEMSVAFAETTPTTPPVLSWARAASWSHSSVCPLRGEGQYLLEHNTHVLSFPGLNPT